MNIAPEKGLKEYQSKMRIGARADAEVCAPYPGRVNDILLLSDGEAAQARRWADFVRACRACGVEQFHVWGLADGVDKNWRDGTHPLLFDEQYREKAAYYAVAEALSE